MNLIKLFWYLIHVELWPDKGHDWKRSECSFLLFSGNQAVVLDFLTLQDKDNKVTLSVNINALVNQARKPQFWLVFLPISKACTNNFYIFWQRVHIVCKSLSWYLHWYYLTYILTTSLQSNCQNHILLEFFSIFTQPWPLTVTLNPHFEHQVILFLNHIGWALRLYIVHVNPVLLFKAILAEPLYHTLCMLI
jgi:hypothetical protein